MEYKVDILWSKHSEHANLLRLELRKALKGIGVIPCWSEQLSSHVYIKFFFKNVEEDMIIVNGHVIYSSDNSHEISHEELAEKIIYFDTFPKLRKRLNMNTSLISALLVTILPKCPFCLAVYVGIFSIAGIELLPFYSWLSYFLALVLIIVMISLTYRAFKRNIYLPVYFAFNPF